MLLHNLHSVADDRLINITISNGKILNISPSDLSTKITGSELFFDNAIVFPGLINSHDHLDFNLFPKLGNRLYSNYVEWGDDIHLNNKEIIEKVLRIPKSLRVEWGIYKNLLNGITTVVNHGPHLDIKTNLINIFQNSHTIHSVQLDKKWILKLNNPFAKNYPFVIHIGEGSDTASFEEIDSLLKWNIFKQKLIGIHGVAMIEKQAEKFMALFGALTRIIVGRTAKIDSLKYKTKIAFGTDSTLSAVGISEQLLIARNSKLVIDVELFEMLTSTPADIWNLKNSGKIATGFDADIVIARKKNKNAMEAFFTLNPEDILMVMHKGNIQMYDESLCKQLNNSNLDISSFSRIQINDSYKFVKGNLPGLISKIKTYYPDIILPVN